MVVHNCYLTTSTLLACTVSTHVKLVILGSHVCRLPTTLIMAWQTATLGDYWCRGEQGDGVLCSCWSTVS